MESLNNSLFQARDRDVEGWACFRGDDLARIRFFSFFPKL